MTISIYEISVLTYIRQLENFSEVLKKAQIFFDNEELAAAHINNVWNKVDQWWYSRLVQDSVNVFCKRYSRRCSKPISSLYNFFSSLK